MRGGADEENVFTQAQIREFIERLQQQTGAKYGYFLKKGLPALFIAVGLATLWLLLRFLVFGSSG